MFAVGRKAGVFCLSLLLVLAMFCFSACVNEAEEQQENNSVIEPGVNEEEDQPNQTTEEEVEEPFPDLGEDTTLSQLTEALSQIDSYYFEQTMPYVDGSVFMEIWYKDPVMKIQTSMEGTLQQISYYDYDAMTVLNAYPGSSSVAMLTSFDPASEDTPDNPVLRDYSEYTEDGFEEINRQTCMKLVGEDGTILWVSTKYGFPLQVSFTDSLGAEYTVQYKNLTVNNVTEEDVMIPADLEIMDLTQQ